LASVHDGRVARANAGVGRASIMFAVAVLYPSVSIASVTSPAAASGIAVAASLRTSKPAPPP